MVINARSIAVRMNENERASKSVSCMRVVKSSVSVRRGGGVATDNPRLMEIELHEEGAARLDVPEIIGQTVGVIAHDSFKEGCKGHNLSVHRSVHREGAL